MYYDYFMLLKYHFRWWLRQTHIYNCFVALKKETQGFTYTYNRDNAGPWIQSVSEESNDLGQLDPEDVLSQQQKSRSTKKSKVAIK